MLANYRTSIKEQDEMDKTPRRGGAIRVLSTTLAIHRPSIVLLLASWVVLSSGCGPDGPKRYQLSGKLTHDGKPVKSAALNFSPDASRGNTGPGSLAIAADGVYRTEANRGVVGGAYTVLVTPIEANSKVTPSFSPYQTSLDLPNADSEYDIEIPKQ